MDVAFAGGRLEVMLVWWVRVAVGAVLLFAAADWVGWATGISQLTRGYPSWPIMTPWSALLLAALGVGMLVQSGSPSRTRVWAGCGLAAAAGVIAVVFLVEYLTGRSSSLDQMFFSESVRGLQASWPGRPSPRTLSSVLLLSIAVAVMRLDRTWIRVLWPLCLATAAAIPGVAALAYLFDTISLVGVTGSTGMGVSTALGLLLLVAAGFAARQDRDPVAWLLARPDRQTLIRLVGIVAGAPILVGLSRLVILGVGLRGDAAWVLSIAVSTAAVGVAAFFSSQREVRLLLEKELLSRKRAEAEGRYRILAGACQMVCVDPKMGRISGHDGRYGNGLATG